MLISMKLLLLMMILVVTGCSAHTTGRISSSRDDIMSRYLVEYSFTTRGGARERFTYSYLVGTT